LVFPKCGSTSLREYLRFQYPELDIQSFPGYSLYHKDWTRNVLGSCQAKNVLCMIIIRNPYDRIWSAYWWSKKLNVDISFEDFLQVGHPQLLNSKDIDSASGVDDPIGCSDYWKYIAKAKGCNPLIVRFEDMIKIPEYPHFAKTDGSDPHGVRKLVLPRLDFKNRIMIRAEFIARGMVHILDDY